MNKTSTGSTILVLRLYIAHNAPNSIKARDNLATICRDHLAGHCDIEMVDVFHEPHRAAADDILLIPSLLKISPLPLVKISGDLSQTDQVLSLLGTAP